MPRVYIFLPRGTPRPIVDRLPAGVCEYRALEVLIFISRIMRIDGQPKPQFDGQPKPHFDGQPKPHQNPPQK